MRHHLLKYKEIKNQNQNVTYCKHAFKIKNFEIVISV